MAMTMTDLLMPDPANVPPEHKFPASIENYYRKMPNTLRGYFDACGKDVKSDPPSVPPVLQVTGEDRSKFANYEATSLALKKAFTAMHESAAKLIPLTRQAGAVGDNGKVEVNAVVDLINTAAQQYPPEGQSESEHILNYLTVALEEGDRLMQDAAKASAKVGDDVDGVSKELKDALEQIKKLTEENQDLKQRLADPVNLTPAPYYPPPATEPSYVNPNTFPTGLDGSGLDSLTPPALDNSDLGTPDVGTPDVNTPPGVDNSGLNGQTPGGIGNIGNTPGGVTTPPTPPVQPASAMSPMGMGGMDIGSMMAQQMMMRALADQGMNQHRADLDPRRFEDEYAPVAPPPAPAPVTTQPATVQQAAATTPAATQHGAAPASTASSTQPAVAPGRTPEADGSVTYTHPNGRPQKVSVMVAQMLDAAYGNASGTDAQKAYEKTSAKWSDKKQIGDRVGDYQLMTGDVATWTNTTAVLVVFPPEGSDASGGSVEVIVKGELKPFDPKMPEIASDTNLFEGFMHPKGIEVTAPTDGGAPPAKSGSADQPADAAMPVVAAG
ncbi:hypothetical protein [Nocardia abscessus]|uniref:hypothetical protein n=2 Tax=Nocardia abscessus TaxID=120957 RepID=UPI002456147B|nr:hypothetical protein [Nocardia abscessus]